MRKHSVLTNVVIGRFAAAARRLNPRPSESLSSSAERGPGIEFLEYITPPGGRALADDAKTNDLVFWHTRLVVDGVNHFAAKLRERQTRCVSKSVLALPDEASKSSRSVIVRDPDGHALQFIEAPKALAGK